MGEYPIQIMDDMKKDKAKRTKQDQVTQAVFSYLQKRNYPITSPCEVTCEEMHSDLLVDREISRPNAVMYNCYNSDPAVIDQNYLKFVSWLKEVGKNKDYEDLLSLLGPLFCHLYLEMIQRGYTEKAANFLKTHFNTIDKSRCNETILKLLHMFTNDTPDLSDLKKKFRTNKYSVKLKPKSLEILKKFLESCHMVMLQVFQSCFEVNFEEEKMDVDNKVVENIGNGLDNNSIPDLDKLKSVINSLKNDHSQICSMVLRNLKEDATCGLINREAGIAIYSYNSSIFIKPIITLKQLQGADELNDIVFREHRKRVYDVSYIPKHNFLVSASQDSTLQLFDLNNYTHKLVYNSHNYPVYCVSSTSNYIASGSYDHTARLWSLENNNTLRVYVGHTQEVTSIDFHPNGLYLCTGSADKCLRMWTINDANPVRLFLGSKGIIYSLAYSSKGKYLASAGDDKRVRIWDLVGGKQIFELKVGSDPIVKLSWNSDDTVLCAGTNEGLVRTWDVNNIGNMGDSGQCNTKCSVNLNGKLLHIENSMGSFGCLTAKMSNSSPL
nr:TAF5-like RNA polymerase II p300/CBP-associated factor-associated factor 65 kDa subunit 5L [Onthophagus taurus]